AFNEGTGRVVFNGSGEQFCSTEEFNILEVNKPSELLYNYPSSNITCQVYDWTSGGIEVGAGTFTALDLAKNGLYGSYSVKPGGTINLHQDASSWIDLNGQLYFDGGGNINIYGGSYASVWPYLGHDVVINMNGGVLDFKDQGIYISNIAYPSFTHNITGGTIRTSKGLGCNRTDFTPFGGTFEFYGSTNAYLDMVSGSHLRNVIINKSSKEGDENYTCEPVYDQRSGQLLSEGTRANNIILNSDIDILGNLTINSGSLKTLPNQVSVSGNVAINNGGQLLVDAGGGLAMAGSKSVTVNNGGLMEFNGESGMQSKITRKSSGYYALNIESGGKIGAEHTIFEYMNTNGVNIKPGAIVDPANAFTSCIFRLGQSGGRLLTLDNNQTLVIYNAVFPGSPSTYNVSKNIDTGMIIFVDHSGNFSGAAREQDPFSRVHWTGDLALSVNLNGVNIEEGQNVCFEALQTITTGGSNIFVVENSASANLVAGQKILMLPGTHAKDGSYLHAWISSVGFCSGLPLSIIASKTEEEVLPTHIKAETLDDERFFRVYPNPTKGVFTLELNSVNDSGSVRIEIFNMLGERILNTEQQTNSHYRFDLSGNKAGVYFIRVNSSGRIDQKKLIKR
ncbi:MAG: T9SS type A sorting domain-containing protein, partial [Bacteroidales bacterium]